MKARRRLCSCVEVNLRPEMYRASNAVWMLAWRSRLRRRVERILSVCEIAVLILCDRESMLRRVEHDGAQYAMCGQTSSMSAGGPRKEGERAKKEARERTRRVRRWQEGCGRLGRAKGRRAWCRARIAWPWSRGVL